MTIKILTVLLSLFMMTNTYGQESLTTKQIGITGLPIFYINNNGSSIGDSFNGIALYGNFGKFFKEKNVIGIRPFYGIVDNGFNKIERMQSVGMNVYYRRYFNNNRWKFFVDGNLGLGYLWYKSKIPSRNEFIESLNGAMFNFAFGPGVNFEIKNGLNLELLVQYLQMENISHPEDTFIGETVIPSLGVQKFF